MLPVHFKHGKFESFVRQLNMYGFAKAGEPSWKEFSHPDFRRGRPDLLDNIQRQRRPKGAPAKTASSAASAALPTRASGRAPVAPPRVLAGPTSNVPAAVASYSASSSSSGSDYEDDESEYMQSRKRSHEGAIVAVDGAAAATSPFTDDAALVLERMQRTDSEVSTMRRWVADRFREMDARVKAAEHRAAAAEAKVDELLASSSVLGATVAPQPFSALADAQWQQQMANSKRLSELQASPAALASLDGDASFDPASMILASPSMQPSDKRQRLITDELKTPQTSFADTVDLTVPANYELKLEEYSVYELPADVQDLSVPPTASHGASQMH